MPKYYEFKVAGYYLYFTSFCVVECMHVHASDKKLTEAGSAKFFVKGNGDSVLQNKGILTGRKSAKFRHSSKKTTKNGRSTVKTDSIADNSFKRQLQRCFGTAAFVYLRFKLFVEKSTFYLCIFQCRPSLGI